MKFVLYGNRRLSSSGIACPFAGDVPSYGFSGHVVHQKDGESDSRYIVALSCTKWEDGRLAGRASICQIAKRAPETQKQWKTKGVLWKDSHAHINKGTDRERDALWETLHYAVANWTCLPSELNKQEANKHQGSSGNWKDNKRYSGTDGSDRGKTFKRCCFCWFLWQSFERRANFFEKQS